MKGERNAIILFERGLDFQYIRIMISPSAQGDVPAPVVQLDRTLDSGSKSWGFESLRARDFGRFLRVFAINRF